MEDYRKPDYEVTVTTDAAQYVRGDTIAVTVDTRYFFGEPVANAEVTLRRYELREDWSIPGQYTVVRKLRHDGSLAARNDGRPMVLFTASADRSTAMPVSDAYG